MNSNARRLSLSSEIARSDVSSRNTTIRNSALLFRTFPFSRPLLCRIRHDSRVFFGAWNVKEDRFLHSSTDDHTATLLQFFIPAFVWAYNELKKAIEVDDRHIQLLEYWQNRLMRSVNTAGRTVALEGPPKPILYDFTLGTGFDIRGARYWQDFFNEEGDIVNPGANTAYFTAPSAYGTGQFSVPDVGGQIALPYAEGSASAPHFGAQFVGPYAAGQAAVPYIQSQVSAPFAGPQFAGPYVMGQVAGPFIAGQTVVPYVPVQASAPYAEGQAQTCSIGGWGAHSEGVPMGLHAPGPHEYVAGPVHYKSGPAPSGKGQGADGEDQGTDQSVEAQLKCKRARSNEELEQLRGLKPSQQVGRADVIGFRAVGEVKRVKKPSEGMCS